MQRMLGIMLFLLGGTCFAAPDLLTVLATATKNDPTYQGQVAEYQVTLQQVPLDRAILLPQLDLASDIQREREKTSTNGRGYITTNNFGLSATQTIFNLNAFHTLRQAHISVQAAAATLSAQQQELMINVAQAYYAVLQANDILNYTIQQKGYLKEQLDATQALFDHREATITELNQAKGAYDSILRDDSQARLSLYNSLQQLSELTSVRYQQLAKLKNNFPLVTPQPENLNTWITLATRNNLNLIASRLNIGAAEEQVKALKANYLPTVSADASYNNGRTPTTDEKNHNISEYNVNSEVGASLNWTIYDGGSRPAQIDQAVAQRNQAEANMRQAYLSAHSQARQAYQGVILGISNIQSDRAAIIANTNALRNAEEGYRTGEQTITEFLQIQNQLFLSERQYANDLYAYLLALLQLQQAAGTLSVNSLAVQNAWLN